MAYESRTVTVLQDAKDRTITGNVNVTQDAKDRTITGNVNVTQDAKDRTITGNVNAIQSTHALLKNTEVNSGDIKTALQKIDNQEDEITYILSEKTNVDGDIIAAPGAGLKLKIHHIYVSSSSDNPAVCKIRDGATPRWVFDFSRDKPLQTQALKRPWLLSTNTALYYDYISGFEPGFWITIGYEVVSA